MKTPKKYFSWGGIAPLIGAGIGAIIGAGAALYKQDAEKPAQQYSPGVIAISESEARKNPITGEGAEKPSQVHIISETAGSNEYLVPKWVDVGFTTPIYDPNIDGGAFLPRKIYALDYELKNVQDQFQKYRDLREALRSRGVPLVEMNIVSDYGNGRYVISEKGLENRVDAMQKMKDKIDGK